MGARLTSENCPDAFSNPTCPYVTQININTCDMKDIKKALLGEDGTGLNGGIAFEIAQLKSKDSVSSSWVATVKPIAIAVASSIFTFLITYALVNRW